MLHDMAKYLANEGDANDGRHNPIPHLFWWAWNSNSADTGGLVTSPNWDQVCPASLPCLGTGRDTYATSTEGDMAHQALLDPAN